MPIFDFKCPKCGKAREVIVKAIEGKLLCSCGALMEKQVSKSNFELKGSGWYKDGYK